MISRAHLQRKFPRLASFGPAVLLATALALLWMLQSSPNAVMGTQLHSFILAALAVSALFGSRRGILAATLLGSFGVWFLSASSPLADRSFLSLAVLLISGALMSFIPLRSVPLGSKTEVDTGVSTNDIDERVQKSSERPAEDHRSELEAVFDSLEVGVFVFSMQGQLLRANASAAIMLGYDSSADLMKDLSYFSQQFELLHLDRTKIDPNEWPIRRVLRGETVVNDVYLARRTDMNFERIFCYSGRPVFDENGQQVLAVIAHEDLTKEMQTEQELARSQTQLDQIANSLPILISYVDKDYVYRFVNQPYAAWFGRPVEQILGCHIKEIVGDAVFAQAEPHFMSAFSGVPVSFEREWVYGDGKERYVHVTYTPDFDENGAVRGVSSSVTDRTEQQKTRERLRESTDLLRLEKQKFEGIFAKSPAVMALVRGRELVFEKVNEAYLELIGRRSVLGKPLIEALPEIKDTVYPEIVRRVFETGEPVHFTEEKSTLAGSNGEVKEAWYDFTYQQIRDGDDDPYGVLLTAIDVTEQVRARQGIEEREVRYRTLTETLPQLVWTCLPDGTCDYLSKQWEDFTGVESLEQLGFKWLDRVLHPEDRERTFKHWMGAVQGHHPYDINYRIRRVDGEYRWFKTRGTPVRNSAGAIVYWFGTCTDIQDQIESAAELEAAKDQAERANELKSAFLANMSHEIRTPLGAMIGFAELLRDLKLSATERTNYLDILVRNGESLAVLINDILDLSKVEAGHLTLEYTDTPIEAITADVVSLLRVKADEKGLSFAFVPDETMPSSVVCDPTRLRQILVNLVGNAVKFTQAGSVVVRGFGCTTESGQSAVCFEVIDTGIGIPEAKRDAVFEVFTQADGSTTRRFGGTGLGLALSRRLARAMGGDVKITRSEEGKGTTFLITIEDHPERRKTEVPSKPSLRVSSEVRSAKSLQGVRVLVVDDAPDNRQLISLYLTKKGAVVESAENGIIGVRKALTGNFDVVLMDIQMPEMDGYTATQKLRAEGFSNPIIALTAHAMTEVRDRILQLGASAHLPKPIRAQDLIAVIAEQIE